MENANCCQYWESPSRSEINKALLAFHMEGISLDKDRTIEAGSRGTRKYITLDNIIRTVRPALAKHGLFIEQHLSGDLFLTRINHVSGEFVCSGIPFQEMQGQGTTKIQNAGGGLTYLRRYALTSILALTADEDDDGSTSTIEVKKAEPKAAKKPMDQVTLDKAAAAIQAGTTTIDKIASVYSLTPDQLAVLSNASKTVPA